jgi:hypothetical protein
VSLTAAVSSKDPRDANNPLTAEKTATIFFNKIVSHKGFPIAIVSDCDSSFTSNFWRALHQLLGTKLFMSTVYHPQTDSLTEHNNSTLLEVLRTQLISHNSAWTYFLSATKFAINSHTHAATGMSPLYMEHSIHPRLPADMPAALKTMSATDFLTLLHAALCSGKEAAAEAQISMQETLDKHSRASPFTVGNYVYLSTEDLTIASNTSTKFKERFMGPFCILELHAHGNAAKLDLPRKYLSTGIHPVFNISRLKLHVPRPPHLGPTAGTNPGPVDAAPDSTPKYIIDHIVRQRVRKNTCHLGWRTLLKCNKTNHACLRKNSTHEVYVQWKGWAPKDDTWELYDNVLAYAPAVIVAFEASRHPKLQPSLSPSPLTSTLPSRSRSQSPPSPPLRRLARTSHRAARS